jgi:23S rRNA pseudouridine1911/1915/1917 synthase
LLRRAARREPARPGDDEVLLERQALHAHRLSLRHPVTDTPMTWIAPLPADMQTVLDTLQESD